MLVAVLPGSSGCNCDLDHHVDKLAGDDAVDCGSSDGERAEVAWDCAIEAFESEEAFTVSWTESGIDSTTTYVRVSDGEKMWELLQGDYRKSAFSKADIDGWDCVSPHVAQKVREDPKYPDAPALEFEYIACTRLEPEDSYYQVCGNFQGGSQEPVEFDP